MMLGPLKAPVAERKLATSRLTDLTPHPDSRYSQLPKSGAVAVELWKKANRPF